PALDPSPLLLTELGLRPTRDLLDQGFAAIVLIRAQPPVNRGAAQAQRFHDITGRFPVLDHATNRQPPHVFERLMVQRPSIDLSHAKIVTHRDHSVCKYVVYPTDLSVNKRRDVWIVTGFSDDSPAVAVANENHWPRLSVDLGFRKLYIFGKR